MLAHEVDCFADTMGLDSDLLVPHNLTDGPPATEEAARFDAVLVGGAGEFSVSKGNLPQQEGYLELLHELVSRGRPMFASCFGFHGLVAALGGEVINDPERMEVGSYELRLTDNAAGDELFGKLPPRFHAQLGHTDRAARLPDGLPNLGASELVPYQALRVPQAPIWATQFHPELDYRTSLARFDYYLECQAALGHQVDGEAEAFRERLRESQEASSLLRAFYELVLG